MNALAAVLGVCVAAPARAPLPEMYRSVASVHWVVKDLEAVKQGWARLGFPALQDWGEVALAVKFRGQEGQTRVRVAMTRMAGLEVYWLQPLEGTSAFSEFLTRHGDGIFSLNHRAASLAALDEEVGRLQRLGIGVLQSTDVQTDAGTLRIVHLDTKDEGKYALGFVHGSVPGTDTASPPPPFPVKLAQFAFVARDFRAVSAFWGRVGLPALELTHDPIGDRLYRGRPAAFDQQLGWQRHGTVVYEWIRSLAGPTVYDDYLKAHGEGVHHLAFEVDDIDKALGIWRAAGFEAAQSGSWGQKGKPGSGRYAYVDTESRGGVFLELLWNR